MSRTTNLVFKFLSELDSRNVQTTIESLGVLLDHLETKNDPEPVELQIVDNAYQTLEKLKSLEGLLKLYIGESDSISKGNKLQNLYEKTSENNGSEVLFD